MAHRTQLRRDIARSQQRRQYLQREQQQEASRQQPHARPEDRRELPEKENQTRHNPVSESCPKDFGFDQQ